MSDYAYDFNAGEGTMAYIQQTNKKITDELDYLKQTIERNLETWDGGARDAYYIAKAQWDQKAAEMNAALARAQVALGHIHEIIGSTEQQGTGMWANMVG